MVTDLIVDGEGNGYVFMGGGERIDRVAADTLKAESWLAIGHPGPRTQRMVGERALLTKDGHTVLFRAADTGNLLRVNLATREVVRLESRELDALDCAALSRTRPTRSPPCRAAARRWRRSASAPRSRASRTSCPHRSRNRASAASRPGAGPRRCATL